MASKRISERPLVTELTTDDLIPIVQDGLDKAIPGRLLGTAEEVSKKLTATSIPAYSVIANHSSSAGIPTGYRYYSSASSNNTLIARSAIGTAEIANPVNALDIANKSYVDEKTLPMIPAYSVLTNNTGSSAIPATGITMSRFATGFTIAQRDTNGVLAVGTPTSDAHATPKSHVDGITGILANLSTINKSNLVNAINEVFESGGGGGGVPILTSPIRIWDLEPGVYLIPANSVVYYNGFSSTVQVTIKGGLLCIQQLLSGYKPWTAIERTDGASVTNFWSGRTTSTGGTYWNTDLSQIPLNATYEEALGGINDSKFMSPLRTRQAIANLTNVTIQELILETTIDDLQATIDIVPKVLNHDVTISVLPGTTSNIITIEGFSGTGKLKILGASSSGLFTHNIGQLIVQFNVLAKNLEIIGFTMTNSNVNAISAFQNSGYVLISMCNSTSGLNTNTANIGVNANENSGYIYCTANTFSNKYYAYRTGMGNKLFVAGPLGTGNGTIYRAENGGSIHRRSAGTIAGTTVSSYSSSGLIVNPSGGTIGT